MEKTQIIFQKGTYLWGTVSHGRKRISDNGYGSQLFL